MATNSASGDPQYLLDATRDLTRRVRDEQRGAWIPLLAFAAVTFAAIPFTRYGVAHPTKCALSTHGAYVCGRYSAVALWYWPVALVLAYAAIGWLYLHRSYQRGVGTRVQPYVVVGVAVVLLITARGLWALGHPGILMGLHPGEPIPRVILAILSPAGAIGLALLLLAWIERSAALLTVTTAYLIVVVATMSVGRSSPSPWSFLPHMLFDGGVLLVGAIVLALAQRAAHRSAA